MFKLLVLDRNTWYHITELFVLKIVTSSYIVSNKCMLAKWLMFNWIVSETYQYLEPFNFVD